MHDYDQTIRELRDPQYVYHYSRDYLKNMMDDAADAIDELQKRVELEYQSGFADGQRAANRKKNKTVKPRWIPVNEEPPLQVGDDGYNGYLVYANGYYEVADYTTDKFDNVPYFHVNGEYETDVTHFMPLPEPPREE